MLGTAAIFMTVFGLVYFFWKDSGSRKPLIFKALATFMPVLLALSAAVSSQTPLAWWTFAGIVCYMAADVLLEIWFLAGVASFGAGHICLITGILLDGRGWRSAVISFVILYGFMFLILRPHLDRLERRLLVPGFVYAALLCIMAAMMASWGIHAGSIQGIIGGAGGIFFVISDTILGWSHLSGKRTRWHSAVLLTLYDLAVYFLAVSLY